MPSERIHFYDACKGIYILLMIFLSNPGSFAALPAFFLHAPWEGMTIVDLLFAGFIFSAGASAYLTFQRHATQLNSATVWRIFRRSTVLFVLGLCCNLQIFTLLAGPNSWDLLLTRLENLRIFGPLQRIALVFAIGSCLCLYLQSRKKILLVCIGLLFFSFASLNLYNPAAPYDMKDNLSRAVDLVFPGEKHSYKRYSRPIPLENLRINRLDSSRILLTPAPEHRIDPQKLILSSNKTVPFTQQAGPDSLLLTAQSPEYGDSLLDYLRTPEIIQESFAFEPEGLLGTVNAIVTLLLGYLAASTLVPHGRLDTNTGLRKCIGFSFIMLASGLVLGQWDIVSKSLWTGSYVLLSGGISMVIFCCMAWMEMNKKYTLFFKAMLPFGANSLVLYLVPIFFAQFIRSRCIVIDNLPIHHWLWTNYFQHLGSQLCGALLFAALYTSIFGVMAVWLYTNKIYIKV